MRFFIITLLLSIISTTAYALEKNDLGLDIYGLSYHYKGVYAGDDYKKNKILNEVNPGIGLRYIFKKLNNNIFSVNFGVYLDSGENNAKYAGLNWQYYATNYFGAGISLNYFETPSYNQSVAPIPNITLKFNKIAANLMWIPNPNEPAVGLSFTLGV